MNQSLAFSKAFYHETENTAKKQRNHIDIDNIFEKLSVGRQMCVALIILPKRIYTNE